MSTGPAVCHHEPLARMADISGLSDLYQLGNTEFVGVSDSGAGFFLPWIMGNISPKTVIIERDVDECEESMRKIGFDMGKSLRLLHKHLLRFKYHPNVMWVDFNSLNNQRIMQKVFWHLLPGVPFDEDRYTRMNATNIAVDVDTIVRQSVDYRREQLQLMREVMGELQTWHG